MATPFNQTTTVQKVIDFCSLHTSLQSFFGVGGVSNEPGLTICNNVQQMLLTKPMPWKFNRKLLDGSNGHFFVTQYGVQDYQFAGACAFALQTTSGSSPNGGVGIDLAASPVNGGTAGITVSAGVVTVQTLDPHPFQVGQTIYMAGNTVSAYNSTLTTSAVTFTSTWSNGWVITTVPDNLHFTFAAAAGQVASSGAPGFGVTDANGNLTGLYAWGWMESASVQDINSTGFPQPIKPIDAVHSLPPAYGTTGNPLSICMIADLNNGVLKFRLSEPLGVQGFQVNMVYQGRAPKLTSPQSVFAWPDDLNYVLYETAMFQAFRYAKGVNGADTRTQFQIVQNVIQSALASEDREDTGHVVAPERSLMRG